MMPMRNWAGVAVVAMFLGAGCASSHKEQPWTAPPRVEWTDLHAAPIEPQAHGYVSLDAGASTGRFPSAIAVSRVAVRHSPETPSPRETYLPGKPKNEFLMWNSALDDQMAVSEVFPIAQRDLGGGSAVPAQIASAGAALGARLALIYAVNELSPTQTEIIGVLYETGTLTGIAAFHAQAESLPPLEDDSSPTDAWRLDSQARVRDEFEQIVHRCLRDLIASDRPVRVDVPEGWTPAGPTEPVIWPPRPFGMRR
jgi:hypothetical protein